MSSDSHDPLDQLLVDWAAARTADDEHTRQLSGQIISAARDEAQAVSDQPVPAALYPEAIPAANWGGKLMIGGSVLLLFLVLAGSLLYYNLTGSPINDQQQAISIDETPLTTALTDEHPAAASLGATVLAAKQQLLSETNALFDNQLAWIADGQRDVSLEVRDHAAGVDDFLLVRVVVARRTSPDAPWLTVWQTDVISRNEALVEVAPEQLDGSSLALWTHLMPEGEVAVDMDLMLDQEMQMQSSSSTVLQSGQPTRVDCSTDNGVEQCVFQTVMPLHLSQI
jgi:hypothetical protein